MKNQDMRINKYLSQCGAASRRGAEQLIGQGRVRINGKPAAIGMNVSPRDKVTLDGKPVALPRNTLTIMLHKPRGIVTTSNDEHGRRCVADLVADTGVRLYPVGRLDRDSEGLLLLTNDGELANAIMHPRKEVKKLYRVTVKPDITEDQINALMSGIMLDGRKTLPCDVRIMQHGEGRTVIMVTLTEGRNRQIRNMCENVGLEVARLRRTEIAGVRLGMLQPGKWRELSKDELSLLKSRVL